MTTTMDKVMALMARFEKYNTITLTSEEEMAVLKFLDESDFLGNGSSRAVYQLFNCVVKVAMSVGGMTQNKVEADFYYDHCYSNCFAHLYAHGRVINIMERLDDCGFYDYEGFYYDEEDEEDCERYTTINDLIDEANERTDYYGSDNGQIGWSTLDNCYKLYDYGYSMDYERHEIVDDVETWMEVVDPIANAIRTLETGEVISQDEFYQIWREKEGFL